jgi:hypothetical protein
MGLLISCPFGQPADDCPLEKYRNESTQNKFEIITQFSNEEVDKIMQHHKECLSRNIQSEQ